MIVAFLYALPLGIVGTALPAGEVSARCRSSLPRAMPAPRRSGREQPEAKPASPTSATGDTIVAIEGMHMSFGGVRALNGVGFTVEPGTIHALIGPNGAGKTVLLNVLVWLLSADRRAGTAQRRGHHRPRPRMRSRGWASPAPSRPRSCSAR